MFHYSRWDSVPSNSMAGICSDFFRFLSIELKPDEEDGGNEKGCDARGLGARDEAEHLLRVIAAQEFEPEAREAVEHDVEGEALALGVVCRAEEQEQCEDDDVELSFPDFSRPERLVAVRVVGERGRRIDDAE